MRLASRHESCSRQERVFLNPIALIEVRSSSWLRPEANGLQTHFNRYLTDCVVYRREGRKKIDTRNPSHISRLFTLFDSFFYRLDNLWTWKAPSCFKRRWFSSWNYVTNSSASVSRSILGTVAQKLRYHLLITTITATAFSKKAHELFNVFTLLS